MERLDNKKSKHIINLFGEIGGGKTQFTKYLAILFQPSEVYRFQTSSFSSSSHAQIVNTLKFNHKTLGEFEVNDTPAILKGVKVEEDDIAKIIDFSKNVGYVNTNLLVISESKCVFNQDLQDALELFVNCFGVESLNNTGILYTHYSGFQKRSQLRDHAARIALELSTRFGLKEVPSIPFFTVNSKQNPCHCFKEICQGIQQINFQEIKELLRWTSTNPQYSTKEIIPKKIQELNGHLAENQRIVKDWEEEAKLIEIVEEPITEETSEVDRCQVPLKFQFPCQKNKRIVKVGQRIIIRKRYLSRKCQRLGSGLVSYGDWKERS